jgi:hypothetical protein
MFKMKKSSTDVCTEIRQSEKLMTCLKIKITLYGLLYLQINVIEIETIFVLFYISTFSLCIVYFQHSGQGQRNFTIHSHRYLSNFNNTKNYGEFETISKFWYKGNPCWTGTREMEVERCRPTYFYVDYV